VTPQKAIEIANAPLKFGVPIYQRRVAAMKMLDKANAIANALARDHIVYVDEAFGQLTKTTLDYMLRYPKYCPVAYAWWEYIQAEAERRRP